MNAAECTPRLFPHDDDAAAVDLKALLHHLLIIAGEPLHIVLEYRGNRVELTTGPAVASAPGKGVKLLEIDRTILEAVAELSGSPTGTEIAARAGYPYDAYLKMRLSFLRRRGYLGGAKGETGYPITDAAYDAMPELQGLLGDPAASIAFVLTPFQESILGALDGKALRTDALGHAVGDRSRLFRKPGGIQELRDHGYLDHHPRLGYYRPDALPIELTPNRPQPNSEPPS